MGAQEGIYHDVKGAPFKIGDKVQFVFTADETADRRFLNREGTVHYFEYECGCGQTFPTDPMIGVKFVRCVKEFWKEELRLIKRNPTRRRAARRSIKS